MRRHHRLRQASNGCVSCSRCGLVLSPLELAGVFKMPPCYERMFAPSDVNRHNVGSAPEHLYGDDPPVGSARSNDERRTT